MASSNVSESETFLSQAEGVREEIRARFSRSHELLRVREAALLSELDELLASYRGEGVREQIQDLNRIIKSMKTTVQRNENQETVATSVAVMNARIRELEVSLETAKDRMRRVELEWDGELEERLNGLGGIRVIGLLDYRKKGTPVMATGKNSFKQSKEAGVFNCPYSVTIDPKTNNVYICDSGNHRIQVFNCSFEFLFQFNDEMAELCYACISENKVYVTQSKCDCLTVYSIEGKLLGSVGKKGNKKLEFHWSAGVAVSTLKNLIYVCDIYNNRIQCLNMNLTFNSFIECILHPRDIQLTQNEIVVLKEGYHCVCIFNYSHQFVREMIRCGEGTLLTNPRYFCLDLQNNILMTDYSSPCVAIFSIRGEFIHKFGKKGYSRGEFIYPSGITLDSDNRIIVLSWNSNCIQLF